VPASFLILMMTAYQLLKFCEKYCTSDTEIMIYSHESRKYVPATPIPMSDGKNEFIVFYEAPENEDSVS
jgi:hypothetical protein